MSIRMHTLIPMFWLVMSILVLGCSSKRTIVTEHSVQICPDTFASEYCHIGECMETLRGLTPREAHMAHAVCVKEYKQCVLEHEFVQGEWMACKDMYEEQ